MLVIEKSGADWAELPARVKEWFEYALNEGEPKKLGLSDDFYMKVARDLQVTINRANNAELWREGETKAANEAPRDLDDRLAKTFLSLGYVKEPDGAISFADVFQGLPADLQKYVETRELRDPDMIPGLKDCSLANIKSRKLQRLMQELNSLQLQIERAESATDDLEEFNGADAWHDRQGGSISLDEMRGWLADGRLFLSGVGAQAFLAIATPTPLGRRKEAWHKIVPVIALLVIHSLRKAKYSGKLSVKREESLVTLIGAEMINWAYGVDISSNAFALALRGRERGKKPRRAGA